MSYNGGDYEALLSNTFESSYGQWQSLDSNYPTGNLELVNGELKVTSNIAFLGVKVLLGDSFVFGDQITFNFDIDTGTTDKIQVYFHEKDASDNHVAYNFMFSEAQTGSHTFTHTISSGSKLYVIVRKSSTSSDVGQQTHFYLDNTFANTGELEIVEENNYYPFGLKHKGYNNVINGTQNNFKTYQGQELTEDLGLNVLEFEFRMYDPAIGRFMQVDPLAEDYAYQSVYNFAENRVIDGNELEGLEWTRFENPDGSTHYTVHFKVLNSTTDRSFGEALSNEQVEEYAEAIKTQTERSFTGEDADGNSVTVSATYEIVESADDIDVENDFYIDIVDKVTSEGKTEAETPATVRIAEGKVDEIGNPTSNRIQISNFTNFGAEEAGSTGAHELGHTAGLRHQNDPANPQDVRDSMERNNLMYNPQRGNSITPQQRSEVRRIVPRVRPVSTIKTLGIKPL